MSTLAPSPSRPSLFEGLGLLNDFSWRRVLGHDDTYTGLLLWGIRLSLILLFTTPLIVTTSTVFPFIVGKAVWSRSLIEIAVGLYVLLAIRSPEYRPRRSILLALMSAHLLALLIAAYFGSSFNLSLWSSYERMGGLIDLTHWFALVGVLAFTVKGLREWKILIGIYLAISWIPIFVALTESFGYQVTGYVPIGRSAGRIGGMSGNPAFLGGQMMINAMLGLALLIDIGRSRANYRISPSAVYGAFLAITVLASLWVLVETGTRGSAAGLMAGLATAAGLFALFSGRSRVRIPILAAGFAVPVVIILLFVGRDTAMVQNLAERNHMVNRFVTLSLESENIQSRVAGLRIASEAFAERPLTGWGGENFEVPFQQLQLEGDFTEESPNLDRAHNKLLDLLATSGLIGFSTYIVMWGWLGLMSWRRVRRESENRHLHVLMAGGLVALFIHNLFLFDTSTTLLPFALVAGWAVVGERGVGIIEPNEGRPSRIPVVIRRATSYAAPVVVAVVVIVLIYGMNFRIFRAAQLITETGSSVEEVVENLDHFPPLSPFGRERLLNVMSDRWERLDPGEQIRLFPILVEQGEKALDAEPDNMALHFAVANLYRTVAGGSQDLLDQARFYTDIGVELGPNTRYAELAIDAQEEAEAGATPGNPG
ncbi:MAG: O-antigen ligase family protein [Chloroflexi bacterium]|jgi:O-antigen ligase|nr:O-antigen ligase family protein [Chloroflexota bacterium]MBT4073004.1 O-antigen ligase family protein [Chloroflexota bacterium]MBT4516082.1 O-antigen ligase family protein [Chloroflexota bacterium]MBT6680750.1 O-antigen ligase family protein [Chloroflexota bacterium]